MLRTPYRYISVTLAAGEVRTLPIYAPFVRLLANSLSVDPQISIDGSFETFPAGLSLTLPETEHFVEIQVYNPDVNPMTLIFAFSSKEVTDTRLTLAGSTFDEILEQLKGDLTPENWGDDIVVGNGASVLLLAANANRKSALIQSDVANTGIIYIGYGALVSSTKKVATLLPGEAFGVDDFCGPIYAISGAAGQNVSASEV